MLMNKAEDVLQEERVKRLNRVVSGADSRTPDLPV